jgi:hypothetical protein
LRLRQGTRCRGDRVRTRGRRYRIQLSSERRTGRTVTSLIKDAGRKVFPLAGDISREPFAESWWKNRVVRSVDWTSQSMLLVTRWPPTVLRRFPRISLTKHSKPTSLRCFGSVRPWYRILSLVRPSSTQPPSRAISHQPAF